MRRGVFIVIFVIIHISAHVGSGIDFNDKQLYKDIQKSYGKSNFIVKEFVVPDSLQPTTKLNGKFFHLTEGQLIFGYAYVGRVISCKSGGCSNSGASTKQNMAIAEFFDYYLLMDTTCTVKTVRIFNYQASYGHEITSKGWLKQFDGYKGDYDLQIGKNIDAISGATVSAYGITHDIEIVVQHSKALLKVL